MGNGPNVQRSPEEQAEYDRVMRDRMLESQWMMPAFDPTVIKAKKRDR